MASFGSRAALIALLPLLTFASASWAGGMGFDAGGLRANVEVRSLYEIRQQDVVRQQWDISCGSAALSTVLTHHYSDPVSEAEIVSAMLQVTNPARVRERGGFSLLDLKRFVERRGYEGKGYAELTVEDLVDLKVPVILPVRIKGYDHFIVFKALLGDRVVFADPAFGNLTMRVDHFERMWSNGLGFVVLQPDATPTPKLGPYIGELPIPNGSAVQRSLLGLIPRAPAGRM